MTFENQEGRQIPQVTFRTRNADGWKDITSSELFDGRTVVVFSLPGAFTPTCSSSHLPRYEQLAAALAKAGVDEIACVSVNDGFVMEAWGRDQQAVNVRLLPDGNGEFTEKMGMLVGKEDLGFGKRSWRYSMLVRNGVIEKMFIEPDKEGDPFEVSDADTMLSYLDPQGSGAADIVVFSKDGCPHCARAKKALQNAELGYEQIVIGKDTGMTTLRAVSGSLTVPQVFVDGTLIGGAEELEVYLTSRDQRAA
ncbi:MAG: glutaredoxin-like protein [Hyphomicrobiaceae bacterium]|jgi:glutaredoxin-like protein